MRLALVAAVCAALLGGCGADAQGDGKAATEALAGAWAEGPRGLYYMQSYDIVSRHLDHRVYLFSPDRWAQNPSGDLTSFDFNAAAPTMAGSWSLAGTRMTMTPATGRAMAGPLVTGTDGCFEFHDSTWCPVHAFATPSIDGAYSGGSSYTSTEGSMAAASDYVFAPDGTWRVLSAAAFNDPESNPDERVLAAGNAQGRYRIEGFTLVLTAGDGSERRGTAFPFGEGADGQRPAFVFFDGRLLRRQGG